jgi:hypothetical protein
MSKLDEEVLAHIERLRLKPRPYIAVLGRRAAFWCLAWLSILLGAISFAVLIFAAFDYARTGGQDFDQMPFDDVAIALPMIWGACSILFAVSAWFGVSRTKRGYRYRPLLVIVLAIITSTLLGGALYSLDVGRRVHEFLAGNFPAYETYTAIPYADWSRPDLGYLGGEVLSMQGQTLRLRAFDGAEWVVDTGDAKISTDGTPYEEGDVAIRGTRTGPGSFKADSVAPFD